MRLFALGLNHRTADVTLRERLVFDNQSLPAAIHRLTELPVVNEAAILSTCNRTELYVAVDDIESSGVHQSLVGYLCDVAGTRSLDLSSHCYSAADANAVAHAFEVASGLDSLVLGEDQILAQVKRSK
jgi:glutamyl-tRNA reductase